MKSINKTNLIKNATTGYFQYEPLISQIIQETSQEDDLSIIMIFYLLRTSWPFLMLVKTINCSEQELAIHFVTNKLNISIEKSTSLYLESLSYIAEGEIVYDF